MWRAHNLETLVDEQVRRWELTREPALPPQPARVPVITISREYGALGTQVGQAVAKRLELTLWDQELVHAIAEKAKASETLLRSLDEHARSALEDMIDGILLGVAYTESEYLRMLMRVVHTIASHGRAVLLGRGIHFLLRGSETLAAWVVAPLDVRIRRVMEAKHLDEHAARRELARIEQERATFLRHQYGHRDDQPELYDVVVNTGRLSVEAAADVIAAAHRGKFTGRRPE